MNLYSQIKKQNNKKLNQIVENTISWCKDKWGINKRRKSKLKINAVYNIDNEEYGNYDFVKNTITIYVHAHKNIRRLIDTIIHEYTHHLQPAYNYWRLDEKYEYNEHPLEIDARYMAKRYRKECWYDIKTEII